MTTDNIVIEKGVPFPKARRVRPQLAERLAAMEVGDSFWVACEPHEKWMMVQINRYCMGTGDTIGTKQEERDGRAGRRVWRMPDED
jgi:hypothetical protein